MVAQYYLTNRYTYDKCVPVSRTLIDIDDVSTMLICLAKGLRRPRPCYLYHTTTTSRCNLISIEYTVERYDQVATIFSKLACVTMSELDGAYTFEWLSATDTYANTNDPFEWYNRERDISKCKN